MSEVKRTNCVVPGVTRALAEWLFNIIPIIGPHWGCEAHVSDYNMYYVNIALGGFQREPGRRRAVRGTSGRSRHGDHYGDRASEASEEAFTGLITCLSRYLNFNCFIDCLFTGLIY
jgi:hypothetical protein